GVYRPPRASAAPARHTPGEGGGWSRGRLPGVTWPRPRGGRWEGVPADEQGAQAGEGDIAPAYPGTVTPAGKLGNAGGALLRPSKQGRPGLPPGVGPPGLGRGGRGNAPRQAYSEL